MKRTFCIYSALTGALFLSSMNFAVFAQQKRSETCKYTIDKVDDFTKKRFVETEGETLFDIKKAGFGLSVSDVLAASKRIFMYVYGCNTDGANGLEFRWGSTDPDYVGTFNQVDLLLDNGEIISFKEEERSESTSNDSWYFSSKIFTINDDASWEKLKIVPVKKLRLYIGGEEHGTQEIDKKNGNSLMKVITCIDLKGIPKLQTTSVSSQNQPNSNQGKVAENSLGSIQPLGNNSTISLYKQWKCITQLNKDGIPKQKYTNHISRFSEDGSCITYTISENGELIVKKNKFQLVSDNKIIVFTTENGTTTSYALTKLTNSELEIKGEIFTNIYIVY